MRNQVTSPCANALRDVILMTTRQKSVMRQNKRSKLQFAKAPLWQRVLAGERLPKRLSPHPKCAAAVEDYRPAALDVRELIRKRVFEQPVGSTFRPSLAYPWLRMMRLNADSFADATTDSALVPEPERL
jgi:hypothetical protein